MVHLLLIVACYPDSTIFTFMIFPLTITTGAFSPQKYIILYYRILLDLPTTLSAPHSSPPNKTVTDFPITILNTELIFSS